MRQVNEEEVFEKASEAKPHLKRVQVELDVPADNEHLQTIRHNLEIIERRSDQA